MMVMMVLVVLLLVVRGGIVCSWAVVVVNGSKALWSIGLDPAGNSGEVIDKKHGFLVLLKAGKDKGLPRDEETYFHELDKIGHLRPCIAHSWRFVAREMGFKDADDDDLWTWLCDQGPPTRFCESPTSIWGSVIRRNIIKAQSTAAGHSEQNLNRE